MPFERISLKIHKIAASVDAIKSSAIVDWRENNKTLSAIALASDASNEIGISE